MTSEEKFFNDFGALAVATTYGSGLFPSVKLAMASHESNFGTSPLAVNDNNYFGVKAYTNPNGFPVTYHNDDSAGEPFRSYSSKAEGFTDQTYFLDGENPRYAEAMKAATPEEQIDKIMLAGYATATYGNVVKERIVKYDLTKYDKKKV